MSEYLSYGGIRAELEPHPLLPTGHHFADEDTVFVTDWGDVLPPVEFSRSQFDELMRLAEHPFDSESGEDLAEEVLKVLVLSQYLAPKLTFDESKGCWLLPLKAEYDEKNRARYPQVNVKALDYKKQLAHRATVEVFMGVPLPRGEGRSNMVDHRCRVHACCNPYHLEVVSHAENNRRGFRARKESTEPSLFQLPVGHAITIGELALLNLQVPSSQID